MIVVWWAETVRLFHAGAQWITMALIVIGIFVWFLPGKPQRPLLASALIKAPGWSSVGAMGYADVLDVVIPWATVGALLLLEYDCKDGQRSLLLAWPTGTASWVLARFLAVSGWGFGWVLLAATLPGWLGEPVILGRAVALVVPVVVFLTGITFVVTEIFHDPWVGVTVCLVVSVLGFGIRGFPFANAGQLDVFSARNHPWSPALLRGEYGLLGLGLLCLGVAWIAFGVHRKRGTYQL